VFHLVSCVPHNEMAVLAGDMNGHVGSSNVGYDGMHCGFRYGDRNAGGSRILEFAEGLNLSHLQHFVHEAGILVGDICSIETYCLQHSTLAPVKCINNI